MPNAFIVVGSPIKTAINGFEFPNKVCGIVKDCYTQNDWNISPIDVLFFGYKEQCERHLKDYPKGIIVEWLSEKLIDI